MTTKIRVTDFDFNSIKSDLRDFLSTRTEFTDYNFEGSNLSVLLDILSSNTHYQALMANFLANEMFLDTAVKRSSVVSHAKSLGYIPKSKTAASTTANVRFSFTTTENTGDSFTLPKGSIFRTNINGINYNFTTTSNYSAPIVSTGGNNYYWLKDEIKLYEGELTTNTIKYSALLKKAVIPDLDVDLSTLTVSIRREGNTFDIYQRVDTALDVSADDQIYFIQEGYGGKYEIYFGDNIFGKEPADGTDIVLNYMLSHGSAGNGAQLYLLNNPLSFANTTQYAQDPIVGESTGGSDRETLQSIKFNALNSFGTQNRAVVASDYAALARGMSSNIKNILSWGGEENIPPKYNTVILCVVPYVGEDLTDGEKKAISDQLKKKAVGAVNITFESPKYIDIGCELSFSYSTKKINISVFELESNVRNSISDYAREFLFNFAGTFKQSKFLTYIDGTDEAITGTSVKLTLTKTLDIQTYINQTHVVEFSSAIDTSSTGSSLSSTNFYTQGTTSLCYLMEDKNYNIHIASKDTSGKEIIIKQNVGRINYDQGTLSFTSYITSFVDSDFKVTVKPRSNDLVSTRSTILRIKNENVTVKSKGE